MDYYFHECTNWRWYYPYHFSPLLKELSKYTVSLENIQDIVKKEKKPHTPEEQLKIVLPQQEDSYYYPKKTPLHSFMKRYYWECHPIMPNHS